MQTIPTSFHWTHGGSDVSIVGSFSGWKEFIPMHKEKDSNIFSHIVKLPVGIHSYKFVVDGEWKFSPDQEQIKDKNGNINNCISITASSKIILFIIYLLFYLTPKHNFLFLLLPADAIDTYPSPSPFRRKKRKEKAMLKNHLLLPGVEEVTRNQDKLTKMDAERKSSLGNLATYASGFQASSGIKLLLVMVGLPARGKSFISRKLCRYLNWLGYKCKVFNLGSYRRQLLGSFHSHDWFRPDNTEGNKARQEMAEMALNDLLQWYQSDNGSVAIFDGTNSSKQRRQLIINRLKKAKPDVIVKPIFIEVICNDQESM